MSNRFIGAFMGTVVGFHPSRGIWNEVPLFTPPIHGKAEFEDLGILLILGFTTQTNYKSISHMA